MAEENPNLDNMEGLAELLGGDMDLDSDGLPSRKKLMEMLASSNLTDEMKNNLRALMGGALAPELFGASSGGSYIGLVFILVIFTILCKSVGVLLPTHLSQLYSRCYYKLLVYCTHINCTILRINSVTCRSTAGGTRKYRRHNKRKKKIIWFGKMEDIKVTKRDTYS